MAKPRVFISSTIYDLKYLRASLKNFIESLGFEPILSENGDIHYSHDKTFVESCCEEVKNSDIFVLIIGMRYGSESSRGEKKASNDSNNRKVSITRSEFRTAIGNEIPTYVFIEKSVICDFETYQLNKDNKDYQSFKYAHVDDSINIFDFIEEIRRLERNNQTKYFDSYPEIETWLKEQWAGKFKELLKKNSKEKEIMTLSTQVSELSELNQSLKRYLEQIVSKVNPEQSEGIIKEENQRLKDFYIMKHNTDLKNFLQEWKSSLPLVPSVEELSFDIYMPTFESIVRDSRINKIEKDLLFEDFKNFHLPKGYENLPDDWEKYKQLLNEYFNENNNIVNKIKSEIQEERFSAESVYTKAVNSLKGGRWVYYREKVSENQSRLMYGVPEIGKGYFIGEKGTDEEVKKLEEQHKTFSDKIEAKYEVELKKLIEKGKELNKRRISLVKIFEDLERYPGFSNMGDCNFSK